MRFETKPEKKDLAVLVSLGSEEATADSLEELERLLETSGGECAAKITQAREKPDPKTFIGKGKCEEIREFIKNYGEEINLVIFDDDLSPSQIANLEDAIDCRVIDRTMLILDIFALHAVTAEGKLQVEIACLKYSAPRLVGKGTQLSRLGGGIGTRGPGETKLESDRRHLQRRISSLEAKLNEVDRQRNTMRSRRMKSTTKTVAIVGYTNAGKSTLLNKLTDAGILEEDKLFATLDPTTRRLNLPSGKSLMLTDTVGFINRLPHHLVKAFKSTLDEVRFADIIIHLCDASDDANTRSMKNEVTAKLLEELGAAAKPTIEVYNKCDKLVDGDLIGNNCIMISARTGKGITKLVEKLEELA